MTTNKSLATAGAIIYLAAAIFTYGNAAWWIGPWESPGTPPQKAPVFVISAPAAALFWPLYWSARIQEPKL